jgi:hypothetical protein
VGEGWLNDFLSTNPWGPIYSEKKRLEWTCGLKGKLHIMKGFIWLPMRHTRHHQTDRLLLHIHETSTMMPHAPSTIAPPPVLRQNWETVAQLASRWSKPLDIDVCSHTVFIHSSGLGRKPTNVVPLGFEAQTKKPSWWFCGPNHQTIAIGFEAQTGKPDWVVLRPIHKSCSH